MFSCVFPLDPRSESLLLDPEFSCSHFWKMDATTQFPVCDCRGVVACVVGTNVKHHLVAVLSSCDDFLLIFGSDVRLITNCICEKVHVSLDTWSHIISLLPHETLITCILS